MFVLDGDGKLPRSQDTTPLDEGNGYNLDRVLAFLDEWKPNKDWFRFFSIDFDSFQLISILFN